MQMLSSNTSTKEFKIKAEMSINLETTIQAHSLEEAWELARETDGGLFSEIEGSGSWKVFDVYEEVSS
jgi:hypothetical protein